MSRTLARIKYLYNSGFYVETENQLLIFDYCLPNPTNNQESLAASVLNKKDLLNKPSVTVFASHGHRDHFNAIVLRWRTWCNNIHYIFSDDIPAKKEAILMAPGDSISLPGIQVRAFPSTDIGVSFLVELDGLVLFHAGDLNLWSSESSTEEGAIAFRKARFAYLRVLKHLRFYNVDVAFFPVDPRIGQGYDKGALYFAKYIKPRLFVPMHFGDDYSVCQNFGEKNPYPTMEIFRIQMRGQQFEYIREN